MSEQGLTPEFAQGYCAMTLDGILREAEITKKVIAAVPDAASSYKHDPNGRTAKELAWHLANTDVQFLDGIADLKFNMANARTQAPNLSRSGGVVRREHEARGGSRGRDDAGAIDDTRQLPGVFNLPAVLYLGFLNNHSIHHRGELATYLRPMGSKVPSIYGGSYDEPFQPPAAEENAA